APFRLGPDRLYELCFRDGAVVGEHAAGTAVRCLAACPLDAAQADLLGLDRRALGGCRTGVNAADVLPYTPYLVLSAGAKEVLMAWLVCLQVGGNQPATSASDGHQGLAAQDPGPTPPPNCQGVDSGLRPQSAAAKADADMEGAQVELEVSSRWLSTRVPRQGLRPRSLRVSQPKASADRRYLALALLGVSSPCPVSQEKHSPETESEAAAATALLSVASSDATASVFTLDLGGSRAWQHVASLEGHKHPVLCMAHIPGVHSTHSSACFTGDDCDVNARGGPESVHGNSSRSCTASISGSGCGTGGAGTACRVAPEGGYWLATGDTRGDVALWWLPCWLHTGRGTRDGPPGRHAVAEPRVLRPVLTIRGVHQSGVNALAIVNAHLAPDPAVPPTPMSQPQAQPQPQPTPSLSSSPSSFLPMRHHGQLGLPIEKAANAIQASSGATSQLGFPASPASQAATADAQLDEVRLVLVTGGDDQALAVLHVRLSRMACLQQTYSGHHHQQPQQPQQQQQQVQPAVWRASLVGVALRPLAHASALRGITAYGGSAPTSESPVPFSSTGGGVNAAGQLGGSCAEAGRMESPQPYVCSVGLDQVVRLWQLQDFAVANCAGAQSPTSPPSRPNPQQQIIDLPCTATAVSDTVSAAGQHTGVSPGSPKPELELAQNVRHCLAIVPTADGSVVLRDTQVAARVRSRGGNTQAGCGTADMVLLQHTGQGTSGDLAKVQYLTGGDLPLVPVPVAASLVEVPEPACLAALPLRSGTAWAAPQRRSGAGWGLGTHMNGEDDKEGDGMGLAECSRSVGEGEVDRPSDQVVVAVAGRGLQLLEGDG
ncbi:hypothetical protein Vretimale_3041, partial [Volvox reticuliferus]